MTSFLAINGLNARMAQHIFLQANHQPKWITFSWDVNYLTGLDYRDVDNKIQSDVNNEVYTVLETSLLIQQKYHSFMFVQISLPWISSPACLLSIFHPIWTLNLKCSTIFCQRQQCIYTYHSPSTPKIYESTTSLPPKKLPPPGDEDTSSLHSAIHLTGDGWLSTGWDSDWLVNGWGGWLVELAEC